MALMDRTSVTALTVLEDGQIQLRTTRRIYDGPLLVGETHHRMVLSPGDDVATQPEQVRQVCAAVWTPDVVTAYRSARAAATAADVLVVPTPPIATKRVVPKKKAKRR